MAQTLQHMSHIFIGFLIATILWSCAAMPQLPADLVLRSKPAEVVGVLGSTTPEVSAWEVGVKSHHQLAQRGNWESTHTRMRFAILAQGMSETASFSFNLWVTEDPNGLKMWWGGVQGDNAGPSNTVNVIIPSWYPLANSATSIDANANFEMNGNVDGKTLVVTFTAEVLFSPAGAVFQHMISNPSVDLGGSQVPVLNWVFDDALG